jgi:hypothetical protein
VVSLVLGDVAKAVGLLKTDGQDVLADIYSLVGFEFASGRRRQQR